MSETKYIQERKELFLIIYIGNGSNHGIKCKPKESLGHTWCIVAGDTKYTQSTIADTYTSYGSSWSATRNFWGKNKKKENSRQ